MTARTLTSVATVSAVFVPLLLVVQVVHLLPSHRIDVVTSSSFSYRDVFTCMPRVPADLLVFSVVIVACCVIFLFYVYRKSIIFVFVFVLLSVLFLDSG